MALIPPQHLRLPVRRVPPDRLRRAQMQLDVLHRTAPARHPHDAPVNRGEPARLPPGDRRSKKTRGFGLNSPIVSQNVPGVDVLKWGGGGGCDFKVSQNVPRGRFVTMFCYLGGPFVTGGRFATIFCDLGGRFATIFCDLGGRFAIIFGEFCDLCFGEFCNGGCFVMPQMSPCLNLVMVRTINIALSKFHITNIFS